MNIAVGRLHAYKAGYHHLLAAELGNHMRKSCDIRCNFTLSEVRVRSVFVFMDFFKMNCCISS